MAVAHDDESTIGPGCDNQFEFSLDLLYGVERLHHRGWMSKN